MSIEQNFNWKNSLQWDANLNEIVMSVKPPKTLVPAFHSRRLNNL